ncbi:MAG: radical SAM protein [Candidatus Omnitrophica bacterium]|nr:radical SAM protein [Candidatus Omnitrophota bacterium]
MKVLLIDPPCDYWGFAGGADSCAPPIALATVAAYLEKNGIDVSIIDCNVEKIDFARLKELIGQRRPKVVGLPSSMMCFVPASFKVAELAKEVSPDIVTVGGGVQFTLTPDEALNRCKALDYVVRGDGEYPFLDLLRELEKSAPNIEKVRGISFRKNNRITHNPDHDVVANLDDLPYPAWHLLPFDKYSLPIIPKKWGGLAMVTTSRGCPHKCTFCSPRLSQYPYRHMSAKKSVDMIEELYRRYNKKVIWLSDLTFNADRKMTEEFLDEIISRKLDVKIAAEGLRAEFIIRDEDLLPKMKKAGLFFGFVGVESCSKKKLDKYKKALAPEQAKKAIRLLKKHGIHTYCFFIIGERDEDREDILETLRFAKELDPTIAIFSCATPFPGTDYYRALEDSGVIEIKDWSKYDLAHPIAPTKYLSIKEVQELQGYCFRSFYVRPLKIIKHVVFGDALERNWYLTQRIRGKDFAQVGMDMEKAKKHWA